MGPLGLQELILVAAIALAIFAPRQIPKLGRVAEKAAKEFRGVKKTVDETRKELDAEFKNSVKF